MSEEELLPGASSGGSTESEDDVFGDSGGGDDFLEDDGGDDFLGDDGGDDDLLGGDGAQMSDGGDMSMDAMDGGGGGGSAVSSEVEARVEEMENEVGSLSSTVNTVQSENEKISESLEDIEENIRKLLEVYEMVTQGVNPFVEDDSLNDTFGPGAGQAEGSGNFGGQSLFDADTEDEEEDVDEDIANADAEEFLDESIIDDEEDDLDDLGEADDEFADESFEDDEFDDAEDGGGDAADEDLSFDELKSEYESGDADWDEEHGEAGSGDEPEEEAFAEADDEFASDEEPFAEADDEFDDDGDELDEFDDDASLEADDDLGLEDDATGLDEGADSLEADEGFESEPLEADETTDAADEAALIPWDDGGRPYLEAVPSEYDTEFVVMDWLEYLVDRAGLDGTAETIRFYGSIHWISDPVEEYLQAILQGFHGGPDVEDPEPRSALGVDHKRSLWWISRIATPEKESPEYEEWLEQEELTIDGTLESDEMEEADDVAGDVGSTAGEESPETIDVGTDPELGTADAGEELRYTEPTGAETTATAGDDAPTSTVEADDVGDEHQSDAGPSDEGTEAGDGDAHRIVIDDSGDDVAVSAETQVQDAPPAPEAELETEGGRMIWVDSDVVLSASGVELRDTRGGYDRRDRAEYVTSLLEETNSSGTDEESHVKPVVVPEDDSDLEPWQIDLIRSVLAPDDDSGR
ncbi:FlaD/FlaE family flagellar protein [Halopiger goleimassiliensis]|uniref:FlaD/FlaE family flagellar protein n=1 Tax=Halopiger goleimassiliensis TaxID=1293048 RepID=UPI001E493159|nr:FlaD/FlaE family flagellar protein [Halopiger goleimassiliensis]